MKDISWEIKILKSRKRASKNAQWRDICCVSLTPQFDPRSNVRVEGEKWLDNIVLWPLHMYASPIKPCPYSNNFGAFSNIIKAYKIFHYFSLPKPMQITITCKFTNQNVSIQNDERKLFFNKTLPVSMHSIHLSYYSRQLTKT